MDRARALNILLALALAAVPAGLALAVRGLEPVSARRLGAAVAAGWRSSPRSRWSAALAALAALVRALRTGSIASLLESGASAALAGGAVVMLTGAGSLAAPVLASAVLLAPHRPRRNPGDRRRSGTADRLGGGGDGRRRGGRAADRIPATADLLSPLAPILLGLAVVGAVVGDRAERGPPVG